MSLYENSPNPSLQGASAPNPTANPNLPPALQPTAAPAQPTYQEWTPQQQAPVTQTQQEMFPRPVVEQLRQENADWRTRYQEVAPYAKAFQGLSPQEIEAQLSILETMKNPDDFADLVLQMMDDPDVQARLEQRRQFQQQGQQQQFPGAPQQAPTLGADDVARIIREQLEQDRAQQYQAQQVEAAKAQIISDAQKLGYNATNDDPAFQALMYFMLQDENSDIQAAHAKVMQLRGGQPQQAPQQFAQPYTGQNGVPASQTSQFVNQFKGRNALADARKALTQMARNGQQLF